MMFHAENFQSSPFLVCYRRVRCFISTFFLCVMHELSIAYSLVELVEEQARVLDINPAARFRAVGVRLGALSGVVKESLLFCFETAVEGTLLEGAALEVEELPIRVYCTTCDKEQTLIGIQSMRCPVCDTLAFGITGGKELELSFIELEDNSNARTDTKHTHRSENHPA